MIKKTAQGGNIPRIIVEPGETLEAVLEREGISHGTPYIARVIVDRVLLPEAPPADALEDAPEDSALEPPPPDPDQRGDRASHDPDSRYEPRKGPWTLW